MNATGTHAARVVTFSQPTPLGKRQAHRAICDDCTWKGKTTADELAAKRESNLHGQPTGGAA